MKKVMLMLSLLLFSGSTLAAACTGDTRIIRLAERDGGWVHVVAEGHSNMDLNNCGAGGTFGLLVNYNDAHGTEKGKDLIMKKLYLSLATGQTVNLCSQRCDTVFTNHSALDTVN